MSSSSHLPNRSREGASDGGYNAVVHKECQVERVEEEEGNLGGVQRVMHGNDAFSQNEETLPQRVLPQDHVYVVLLHSQQAYETYGKVADDNIRGNSQRTLSDSMHNLPNT